MVDLLGFNTKLMFRRHSHSYNCAESSGMISFLQSAEPEPQYVRGQLMDLLMKWNKSTISGAAADIFSEIQ